MVVARFGYPDLARLWTTKLDHVDVLPGYAATVAASDTDEGDLG